MSIKNLPSKLYKYKRVSKGVLDGLSKGKVWFSHLDKLNDPYENCKLPHNCQLPIFRTGLKYTKSPCSCQPILHRSKII